MRPVRKKSLQCDRNMHCVSDLYCVMLTSMIDRRECVLSESQAADTWKKKYGNKLETYDAVSEKRYILKLVKSAAAY